MFKEEIVISKSKRMRIIVEEELKLVNAVLEDSIKEELTEAINTQLAQQVILEDILRKFDEI